MPADAVQDAITHFIGEFALTVEEARARLDHVGEGIARPKIAHEGKATPAAPEADAGHALDTFAPALRGAPTEAPALGALPPGLLRLDLPGLMAPMTAPVRLERDDDARAGPGAGPDFQILPPPLPGSVVLVAVQENLLSDIDILFSEPLPAFLAPQAVDPGPWLGLARALDPVAGLAPAAPENGAALAPETLRLAGEIGGMAARFAPQPANAAPIPPEPALFEASAGAVALSLAVMPGAEGVFVNGVAAEALPEIAPERLSPPDLPEDPATAPLPETGARAEADDVAGDAAEADPLPEPAPQPPHALSTGENVLINEVVLTARWVDAPAYVVAGDALSVAMIAQTALMRDADSGAWAPEGAVAGAVVNAAAFLTDPAPPAPPPEASAGLFPQSWAVATLEGDLVALNWIWQTNFVIEHDIVSVVLDGQESWVVLGGNLAQNAVASSVFGYGYDLIVIDGDFLQLSLIAQTNLLLDDDAFAAPGPGGDNLLWNEASITREGTTAMVPLAGEWAALSADFAAREASVPDGVLSDPAFAGQSGLSVLHVTGDLIALDVVMQTNVLGDADTVSARLSDAAALPGAALSVQAGANTLANIAHIKTGGMDSTVHAGGEIYSDALLYQASLIDTGAAPGAPAALVNEAVAFLAEGMLGDEAEPEAGGGAGAGLAGDAAPQGLDAMIA